MRGEVFGLRAVAEPVPRAHGQLREVREHVELRQREPVDAVHADCIAQRDEVEPAAPPVASGDDAVLVSDLADLVVVGSLDLRREGAFADAGDVRLRDAHHAVDLVRTDADACCSVCGDGARRGDERIRAVVDVEERALAALEEHGLSFLQCPVDEQRCIRNVGPDPLRVLLEPPRDLAELECGLAVHLLQPQVLLGERDLDLLAEDLGIEQILHADADAQRLVGVGRPDAAASRSDLELAEPALARLVDRQVPRHDHVRVARDVHASRGGEPARLELVDLRQEHGRVDDAAGTDDAGLAGDDAARDLADLVRLAADHDRVPCVRAALIAAHEIRVLREQVDDLALAFVSPLRADDDCRWHLRKCRAGAGLRASLLYGP